eukprot:586128-Alexandrium_andersonii.AAC.1
MAGDWDQQQCDMFAAIQALIVVAQSGIGEQCEVHLTSAFAHAILRGGSASGRVSRMAAIAHDLLRFTSGASLGWDGRVPR